jgi:hypothetical protein
MSVPPASASRHTLWFIDEVNSTDMNNTRTANMTNICRGKKILTMNIVNCRAFIYDMSFQTSSSSLIAWKNGNNLDRKSSDMIAIIRSSLWLQLRPFVGIVISPYTLFITYYKRSGGMISLRRDIRV